MSWTDGAPRQASPLLPVLKAQLDALTLQAEDVQEHPAFTDAVRAFLQAGPELLDAATPSLRQYYASTVSGFSPEECREYGIPLLPDDTDVWTQVTLPHPPVLERGDPPHAPARAYLTFEGEVSWEEEHRLMLVFADGATLCTVGPYDGHVTNACAYDDLGLLGVVFR